jgi:hypothetical protein
MSTEREEDFSLEDDKEVQSTFTGMAHSEFSSLLSRLKYEERRNRLLFKRSLGRKERKRLKAKYAQPSSK